MVEAMTIPTPPPSSGPVPSGPVPSEPIPSEPNPSGPRPSEPNPLGSTTYGYQGHQSSPVQGVRPDLGVLHGADLFGAAPQPGAAPHTVAPFHRPEDFPTSAANDGRLAWMLGLIAFLPIPVIGLFAAVIAMVVTGLRMGGKNPVARAVGRRAAICAAIQVIPLLTGAGFIIWNLTVLHGASMRFEDHPIALMIWIGSCVWAAILAPLLLVTMGIIGLARPVSREKAAQVLAASGR